MMLAIICGIGAKCGCLENHLRRCAVVLSTRAMKDVAFLWHLLDGEVYEEVVVLGVCAGRGWATRMLCGSDVIHSPLAQCLVMCLCLVGV